MINFKKSLRETHQDIFNVIEKETKRQDLGLEMIASENYASLAVMEAQGSILTNKYAEGYPNKRYYGGCEHVDTLESIAIERLKELFGCSFANVQPHSGSQANMGAYFSVLNPGDKIMGMELATGGHLTHGSPVNFSGKIFEIVSYGVDKKTEQIDYNQMRELALKTRPKIIVAGASAYPRLIDFEKFSSIAKEVGAYFMADMAHIAGLVAAGQHPSPFPHADIVTSTTHKTLRGPRGGVILTNNPDLAKKINFNIFPGIQGGPLEHVIAAKAVAFAEALDKDFVSYQKQVVKNVQVLVEVFNKNNVKMVSGGSDNHMVLIKTDSVNLTGKAAEAVLEEAGITSNKNMIPYDTRSPFVTSGVRLGTAALTTRGFRDEEMELVGEWICSALKDNSPNNLADIYDKVIALCKKFPIY